MTAEADAKKSGAAGPSMAAVLRAELPMLVGVATTLLIFTIGHGWVANFGNLAVTATLFVWMFAVMIWCAFAVVRHAEALAQFCGEPYGTLILTLSVVTIEVTIMATVMLSGDPNPTLPRDTVFAVLMIVLNGMVGTSVIIGALRHKQQQYSLQGAIAFLAVITSLSVISLVLPTFTYSASRAALTWWQAVVFTVLTGSLYAGFLAIQTMRHRAFFTEAGGATNDDHATARYPVWAHAMLLVLSLLPVVLLAEPLAGIIDFSLEKLHAPTALGGIVIAILVLSPEGLSSFRAAAHNHLQRSVNLSLGSALSTIGLTIPAMLIISLVTGTPLDLGLPPAQAILLGLTLVISQMTFSGAPTNILLGGVHLVLFATFLVLIFN
ncbi:calcium:proton antiporter [Pseudolabrys sp. FHR47]|uniref:calcium:proton antiporter n=1 Tax=Pseudolabrys sp. FHR47 TaxID=2562284 RepID=UPI00197D0478|nr:calcium:proton antiporter [Pseudolabrys sp. FHR47]